VTAAIAPPAATSVAVDVPSAVTTGASIAVTVTVPPSLVAAADGSPLTVTVRPEAGSDLVQASVQKAIVASPGTLHFTFTAGSGEGAAGFAVGVATATRGLTAVLSSPVTVADLAAPVVAGGPPLTISPAPAGERPIGYRCTAANGAVTFLPALQGTLVVPVSRLAGQGPWMVQAVGADGALSQAVSLP